MTLLIFQFDIPDKVNREEQFEKISIRQVKLFGKNLKLSFKSEAIEL